MQPLDLEERVGDQEPSSDDALHPPARRVDEAREGGEVEGRLFHAAVAEQFEPALERGVFNVAPGDRFLLCTDGLWEYIQENELEQSLSESSNAESWLKALQRLVVSRGKRRHDNYSAVAVWCE